MLKARLRTETGESLIVLGLEDGNIERLKIGEPIMFSLEELGFEPPINVVIMVGRDNAAIKAQLQEWFVVEGGWG